MTNTRKKVAGLLFILCLPLIQGLVVRDDVADEKFIEAGKNYPEICHFVNGEGVLMNDGWVLTAGHVAKEIARSLNDGLTQKVKCNGKEYDITIVRVHPEFAGPESGLKNDIGIVKLKTVPEVKGVEIYTDPDEVGKEIILVGSGDTGNGKTGPQVWDKIVRAATNKVDDADEQWISFSFDAPGSGRATAMEGISGPGDSGGPALINKDGKRFVAGISSHQLGQDKYGKGKYGVTEYYSRVSVYINWIQETISGKEEDSLKHEIYEDVSLKEYAGTYGFRKVIYESGALYFQRDNEPLIAMKKTGMDLFVWDDNRTKLQFVRTTAGKISGFNILRMNGEVVKVERTDN